MQYTQQYGHSQTSANQSILAKTTRRVGIRIEASFDGPVLEMTTFRNSDHYWRTAVALVQIDHSLSTPGSDEEFLRDFASRLEAIKLAHDVHGR